MFLDWAAGGVLVCGAVACAAMAVGGKGSRPFAAAAFGAALACAGLRELSRPHGVRFALGLALVGRLRARLVGIGGLIVGRLGRPSRLSWLDAAMGASAVAALAVTAGLAAPVVAGWGAAAALGLSRWRTTPALLSGIAGLALLGADGPSPSLRSYRSWSPPSWTSRVRVPARSSARSC